MFVKKVKKLKGKSLDRTHPWRCLWRGFLQITRTTFLRFTILQLAQSLFTDGRTFIIQGKPGERSALSSLAIGNSPFRQIVG